jgi:hypothetical protein
MSRGYGCQSVLFVNMFCHAQLSAPASPLPLLTLHHSRTPLHHMPALLSHPCLLNPLRLLSGLVYQPPLVTGQLLAVRTSDRSLSVCVRHLEPLQMCPPACLPSSSTPIRPGAQHPSRSQSVTPSLTLSCTAPVLPLSGLVYQPPLATGQLLAVRTSDRSLSVCVRHLEALKQLAASYWALPRHPGWALAPDPPVRMWMQG